MRSGRKVAVQDHTPLPFKPELVGSARFAKFCERFIRVPKGHNELAALRLHDFQRELVGTVMDAPVTPTLAGFMLPRGSGKTTLLAAWGLYVLMTGGEGAKVVVCAVDERQAALCFNIARRMVELHNDLAKRVEVYKTELRVPGRDASFQCLPSEPKSLEGLDFNLCIIDEFGVVPREVFEVLALAMGKRPHSTLLGIGTPGVTGLDSVLGDMRAAAAEDPDDTSVVWREWSAAGFEHHDVDCEHCWALANPAIEAGFLNLATLRALLPPRTREAVFRRARLCQFVIEEEGSFLPPGTWDALSTGQRVPDGVEVVLAFDGSFSEDSTALVVATVSPKPHFDVVGCWQKPADATAWRVPITEVEDAIRLATARWKVIEVAADPFRWARSLQLLADEGVAVHEFPQSPQRMTAATSDFYQSSMNGNLSHSGDPRLSAHIANAVVQEDNRGIRLSKRPRQRTAPKVDLAVAALMAHSRATWRATHRRRRRVVAFK